MALTSIEQLLSNQGQPEEQTALEKFLAEIAQPVVVEEPEERSGTAAFGESILEIPPRFSAGRLESKSASGLHSSVFELQEMAENVVAVLPFIDEEGLLTEEGNTGFPFDISRAQNKSFRKLVDALKGGSNIKDLATSSFKTIQSTLDEAKNQALLGEFKRPPTAKATERLLATKGTPVGEVLDVATSPEAAVDLLADSLHSTLLIMGAGIGGAVIGSRAGPLGTIFGLLEGVGFASYNLERKRQLVEEMLKADVDVYSAEALMDFIINNPNEFAKVIHNSEVTGIATGAFDAAGALLGGKSLLAARDILRAPVKPGLVAAVTKAAKVSALTIAEPTIQAVSGGGGAAASAVARGEEIDTDEVALEALAEFFSFGGEASIGYVVNKVDRLQEEKRKIEAGDPDPTNAKAVASVREMMAEAEAMTPEELDASIAELTGELGGTAKDNFVEESTAEALPSADSATIDDRLAAGVASAKAKREAKEQAEQAQETAKKTIKEALQEEIANDPVAERKAELQAAFEEGREIRSQREVVKQAEEAAGIVQRFDKNEQAETPPDMDRLSVKIENEFEVLKLTNKDQELQSLLGKAISSQFVNGGPKQAIGWIKIAITAGRMDVAEYMVSRLNLDSSTSRYTESKQEILALLEPETAKDEVAEEVEAATPDNIPNIEDLPDVTPIESEFTSEQIDEAVDAMTDADLSGKQLAALAKQEGFELELDDKGVAQISINDLERLATGTLRTAATLTPGAKPEPATQAEKDTQARLAALNTELETIEQESAAQDVQTATLLKDIDLKREIKDTKLKGTAKSRKAAAKKAARPTKQQRTAKQIGQMIARKEDRQRKAWDVLDLLNATLRGRKDFTHVTNGGIGKKGQWQFEAIKDDGDTFVLVFRTMNENGTDSPNGIVYEINFDAQTYTMVEKQGTATTKYTRLSDIASSPNSIFNVVIGAHKSAVTNNPSLFNSDTVLREMGQAVTREEHVQAEEGKAFDSIDLVEKTAASRDRAEARMVRTEAILRKHANKPKDYSTAEKKKTRSIYLEARMDFIIADLVWVRAKRAKIDPDTAKANARAAQDTTIAQFIEANGDVALIDVTSKMPKITVDGKAEIRTFMREPELDGVLRKTTDTATAVQFLTDGTTRFLRIRPSETESKINAYEAVVEGISNGKLATSINIGKTKFKVAKGDIDRIQKMAAHAAKAKRAQVISDVATARKETQKTGGLKGAPGKTNRQGKFKDNTFLRVQSLNDQLRELTDKIHLLDTVGIDEASTENPLDLMLDETGERSIKELGTDEEITRIAALNERDRAAERTITAAEKVRVDNELTDTTKIRSSSEDTQAGQVAVGFAKGGIDPETGVERTAKTFVTVGMFEQEYPEAAKHLREVEAEESRLLRETEKAGEAAARKETLRNIANNIFADVTDPNPDTAVLGRDALAKWTHLELQTMYDSARLKELAKVIGAKRTGNKDVIASNIVGKLEQAPVNKARVPVHEQMREILERQGFTPEAVTTTEGRAVVNVGYIKSMRDMLGAQEFSEAYINVAVRNILAGNSSDQAARAQAFINSKLLDQQTLNAFRLSLDESIEMQATIKASADLTTKLGVLVDNFNDNAKGLSEEALLEGMKTVTGEEFARTPDFIAKPTTLDQEIKEELERDELRAEIEGLQAEDARTDRPTETLTTAGPRAFGSTNRGVSREEAAEMVKRLQGRFRSVGISPGETEALVKISVFLIEGGIRTFAEFSAAMVKKLGEKVTPHLNDLWETVTNTKAVVEGTPIETPGDPRLTIDLDTVLPPKLDPVAVIPGHRPSITALAAIEDKLAGNVTVDTTIMHDQQNHALDDLHNGLAESFFTPLWRGASKGLSAMAHGIMYGTRYLTQSADVLPRTSVQALSVQQIEDSFRQGPAAQEFGRTNMKDAATFLDSSRSRTNGHVVYMMLFNTRLKSLLAQSGIELGSREHGQMNKAITEYISGHMREDSILKEFGVVIPDIIKAHIGKYVAHKGALSELASMIDAVPVKTQHAIAKTGDMWLHKSYQALPSLDRLYEMVRGGKAAIDAIKAVDPELLRKLMHSAKDFYSLPTTVEEFRSMPADSIRAMIGGVNSLYQAKKSKGKKGRYILEPAPVLDDNGVAVLDKKGKPKLKQVTLKKATHAQLVSYVMARKPNEEQILNFVAAMINSIYTPSGLGAPGAAARGADQSILKTKSIMKSQAEQIDTMIDHLSKAEGMNPDIVTALKEDRDELTRYNREEFRIAVSKLDPGARAVAERSELEYAMTDQIRKGLGEVTDPGALMVDSVARLASTVEQSKALTAIVETGVLSGELAIGKPNVERGKHTRALGILGKVGRHGAKDVITGLSDIFYRDMDGGVHQVIDKKDGQPTIYGTPATINALHRLMGAHAAVQRSLFTKTMYAAAGMTKYDKILLSFTAHPRNMTSSSEIALARGVFGTAINPFVHIFTDPGAFMLGSDLAITELKQTLSSKKSLAATEHLLTKDGLGNLEVIIATRGITHDSVHTGAVQDLFSHLQTLDAAEWDMVMANQTSLMRGADGRIHNAKTGILSKGSRGIAAITGTAETSFRLEDEAVKIVGFLQRTKQFLTIMAGNNRLADKRHSGQLLRNYLSTEGRATLTVEEIGEIETAMDMAQTNIIATFPTFSQASAAIKSGSRNPLFSAFPTFNAEMVRTSFNHLAFSLRLLNGQLPNGTKVTGEAKRRAYLLGLGLITQGALVIGGQMTALAVMNLVASRTGKKDPEDERALNVVGYLTEAITNHRDAYNVYDFKNVLPSWYETSNVAVVPFTLDINRHTINFIPTDFTMAEGATLAAGYKFNNDAVEILSNDTLTEHFKDEVIKQVLRAFLEAAGGLYFNEEILLSDVVSNVMERDGANSDNIENAHRAAARTLNQWTRAAFSGANNPLATNIDRPTEGMATQAAGLLTALATSLPGNTAVSQILKASKSVATSAEMAANPMTFALDVLGNTAAVTSGIKFEEFDYLRDYEKKLMFQHAPLLMQRTDNMRNVLLSPQWQPSPGTEEEMRAEFDAMYDLLNGYRSKAFDNISAALNTGRDRFGVSPDEMNTLWSNASGGNALTSLAGFTQAQFREPGNYRAPTLTGDLEAAYMREWDEVDSGFGYAMRVDWFRQNSIRGVD